MNFIATTPLSFWLRRMKLTENSGLDAAALIAATGLTRFLFRSHYLYDIDSVNFALGLKRFDTTVHQPHPPGYFLYICLGRLASLFFHDANSALVAISILFSCAAVAMIFLLADSWFGRGAARFAGLIFLFSPLAWFHGIVALTYIVEAFFSALVGYLCWRADRGDSTHSCRPQLLWVSRRAFVRHRFCSWHRCCSGPCVTLRESMRYRELALWY